MKSRATLWTYLNGHTTYTNKYTLKRWITMSKWSVRDMQRNLHRIDRKKGLEERYPELVEDIASKVWKELNGEG